ncbi:MAG: Hpt domain-containing protein [Myxococcota bacterium]
MDLSELEMLIEALGEEDVVGLLEIFLGDSMTQLEVIRGHLASGDHHQLTRAAHTLKGSSLNMGARELADACAQLEKSADVAEAQTLLAAVEAEAEKVREIFGGELARLRAKVAAA